MTEPPWVLGQSRKIKGIISSISLICLILDIISSKRLKKKNPISWLLMPKEKTPQAKKIVRPIASIFSKRKFLMLKKKKKKARLIRRPLKTVKPQSPPNLKTGKIMA